ncbi:MAG: glucokinase [Thermodesulfobium narugense]|nr:MAG: glucokinase [Thermodesulfobium narugense]
MIYNTAMADIAQFDYYIGIDIGGTRTRVGRFSKDCKLEEKEVIETIRYKKSPEFLLEEIAKKILGLKKPNSEFAIGISAPGPCDTKMGIVKNPPNLPGWGEVRVSEFFKNKFDTYVSLENDANAAAFAEYKIGSGKGYKNMVYFTLSTGIGGGIIINGKIYRGFMDSAGEFGHQIVLPNGPKCRCGSKGCLEAVSSGYAISRDAISKALVRKSGILYEIYKKNGAINASDVFLASSQGDDISWKILNKAITYMGIGISNVITVLSPECVVLGGGLTNQDYIIDEIRNFAATHVKMAPINKIKIVKSFLGDDSSLYGSVLNTIDSF